MPLRIVKYERYPTSDRNAFGMAALNLCRALRTNPKIRSSRYYWVATNTLAVVTEGTPDCFDYNPDPNPEIGKALYALADLAQPGPAETWLDAGVGTQSWDRAGRPSGTG